LFPAILRPLALIPSLFIVASINDLLPTCYTLSPFTSSCLPLPRRDTTVKEVIAQLAKRHKQRQALIDSAYRRRASKTLLLHVEIKELDKSDGDERNEKDLLSKIIEVMELKRWDWYQSKPVKLLRIKSAFPCHFDFYSFRPLDSGTFRPFVPLPYLNFPSE